MKMSISWYYLSSFEQKFHFSSLKCDICYKSFSRNRKSITTFKQFMKEKSYCNATFMNLGLNQNKPLSTMFHFLMNKHRNLMNVKSVMQHLQQNQVLKTILQALMKGRNDSNVTFAPPLFLHKVVCLDTISKVHEGMWHLPNSLSFYS